MARSAFGKKLRRIWNWLQGKRITLVDPARGRVVVRTGRNSSTRSNGGQWYIVRYEIASGLPPLPRGARGRLDRPKSILIAKRCLGEQHVLARRWYERRHGTLPEGHDLDLVCVYDSSVSTADEGIMHYQPSEVFEIEHPWLSSTDHGRSFPSYFGTWYGSGTLKEQDLMDFEAFWELRPSARPLPKWGATWR